ncbi:50S ribosomal protein L29 [Candidatus Hepatincolaceae symbiont of Richtersius coronifer]
MNVKNLKSKDLRSKNDLDLKQEMLKLRKDLFNIRFQKASGQMEGVNQLRFMRKNIAKIKTLLTEKTKNIR